MYQLPTGKYVHTIKSLHDRYGPVVRVSPNELSFCSESSWKTIYGHVQGRREFQKSSMYDSAPGEAPSVLGIRDIDTHAFVRKTLSHAFSAGALAAQEDLVQDHIDLFVKQVSTHCTKEPGDVTKWYNYLTFDVVGQLSFGESFGALASGLCSFPLSNKTILRLKKTNQHSIGRSHYWIDIIFASARTNHYLRGSGYIPVIKTLLFKLYAAGLVPATFKEPRQKQIEYSRDKIEK